MAPSFLKELRRRSKSSFRTEKTGRTSGSTDSNNGTGESNGSSESNGVDSALAMKSSSTLNSSFGANTPPAITSPNSATNLQTLGNGVAQHAMQPTRPTITINNRHSVSGMAGLGSPNGSTTLPVSPYAPRILSIENGTWVHQKVLLVYGIIADPTVQPMDGTLTVSRLDDNVPPMNWPVSESHFKALLYLLPGVNRFRFDFTSPKLHHSNTSNKIHSSYLTLPMAPNSAAPPLQLVILLGRDSVATYDAVPARTEREGNGLETAIRKFRMAAYLWQSFTAEQMYRNKMGRRTFRFDEEWVNGTSNLRDMETGAMRSEAKVHVVRCDKTVAELRDLDRAQQNPKAKQSGDLFSIALDAMKNYFKPLPGQKQYVSVLLLDSHWDKASKTITGHAALGGVNDPISMAIFGSHALQSYPSSLEEVVPAFSDCTPTDTNYVGNDCNESGSNWEAANIGIGAHLHEVGHLFGCPHQEGGIMLRDYVTLNRTFTTREPYSTRTKTKGGLVLQGDECVWHRLDCLRFRSHPAFGLPAEPPKHIDDSVQAFPVDNGNVIVTAPSGIAFLEIRFEGEEVCHHWQEYGDGNGGGPIQRQLTLSEQDLKNLVPEDRRKSKLQISIKSHAGGSHEIADWGALTSKSARLKLSNGHMAFRGSKLGLSQMEGSRAEEVIFNSVLKQTKLMTQVKVYHGFALDGIEFVYEDSTSQLFGKRGGKPGGSEFNLDTRRGEHILGFYVRSGFWIDGIAIMTSLGRKSAVYGNANGGSGHTLLAPRGYSIAGVIGSAGNWIDGFGVLITR